MEKGNEKYYQIANIILNEFKNINSIRSLDGMWGQRVNTKAMVRAEVKRQNITLTSEEVSKIAAYVELQCDE